MKTDEAWKPWAEKASSYGVLTEPKFRKGDIETNRQAFFKITFRATHADE